MAAATPDAETCSPLVVVIRECDSPLVAEHSHGTRCHLVVTQRTTQSTHIIMIKVFTLKYRNKAAMNSTRHISVDPSQLTVTMATMQITPPHHVSPHVTPPLRAAGLSRGSTVMAESLLALRQPLQATDHLHVTTHVTAEAVPLPLYITT